MIVLCVYAYALMGFLFSLYFIKVGVERVDEMARHSSWGFRLIIWPGAVLFWPYLWWRCMKHPDIMEENNAHRRKALLRNMGCESCIDGCGCCLL